MTMGFSACVLVVLAASISGRVVVQGLGILRQPVRVRKTTQLHTRVRNETATTELEPTKKQRCFDFPPYYYSRSTALQTREDRKKLRVKISSGTGGERIYERAPNPYIPFKAFTFRILESVEKSAVRTRLLEDRSYGRKEPFLTQNLCEPPTLEDITSATRKTGWLDSLWISLPARLLTFATAYYSFPFVIQGLNYFVTMQPDQLDQITSKLEPVIAIVYGTFVSLTLQILYERQRRIQDAVAMEAALLVNLTRSLLSIFRRDKAKSVDAGQCTADQIRTLVDSSRGEELMLIMYSDPYARMSDLLDDFEETSGADTWSRKGGHVGNSRDNIRDLMRIRSNRLSDEALSLPPTHFLVLNLLTTLILLSYSISTLPTADRLGAPSNESSLLFGILAATYILFFNFAQDLNEPFSGVYQVRRSTAATHFLEAKWLLVNHPNTVGEIDFERIDESDSDSVLIRTPGIGEFWFEKDDLFVDGKGTP
jgi:hypothetical protein